MSITKTVESCPFEETTLTKEQEIDKVLDSLPNLSAEELANYALQMNYAASKGLLPQLTPQEHAALKTISQKCIPDAPKQINLNASVKTESVILHWLQNNKPLLDKTNDRIEAQATLELEQLSGLEGFRENFSPDDTAREEDGDE